MTLRKVISGGQTGVDIAGLRAARWAGIETGGWCPKGWLTELGPRPDVLQGFGLREHESPKYPPRTGANIKEADCTIIIADKWDAGSKLTASLCRRMKKPELHVARSELNPEYEAGSEEVVAWLRSQLHMVVNIAGNRESKAPGIEQEAELFLRRVFAALT